MWLNTNTNTAQNDRPTELVVNGVTYKGADLTDSLLTSNGWVEQPDVDYSQGEYVGE